MKLHFPWPAIERCLQAIRTARTAKPLYGRHTGKGLWLVGDHGVYVMPNTTDGVCNAPRENSDRSLLVYARECDPTKLDFDAWWENKRASFGGDDGVEFLDAEAIAQLATHPPEPRATPEWLVIEMAPAEISLGIAWRIRR
jgi:hypothetical protein